MSVHKARVVWRRETESFDYPDYSRNHLWRFDAAEVAASAAPGFLGDPERIDPEEAFVASVAACHMLTFLAIASRKKYTVDAYDDEATGVLSNNAEGRLAVTRVTLRPRIVFGAQRRPDALAIERMHELAHKECFIANSVRTEIVVEALNTPEA